MLVQNVLIQGQHEFFKKKSKDIFNGHAYVDLGLPSGTLWAKMNVGATSETDYGLYFSWGETQGYPDASTKAFNWDDYKYGVYNFQDGNKGMTKYNKTDNKVILDAEDDAVAVNMGGEWHMPIKEQCEELLNTEYVTNEWIENYNNSGIKGRLFTSVSNGNTLFIPTAGFNESSRSNAVGSAGFVWLSSLYDGSSIDEAYYLYFDSSRKDISSTRDRCGGLSVRGVIGKIDDTILI